jgi:predicted NUDIX family NTP pyrophosphohydrolase
VLIRILEISEGKEEGSRIVSAWTKEAQVSKTKITDSTFRIEHLIIRTVSHQF